MAAERVRAVRSSRELKEMKLDQIQSFRFFFTKDNDVTDFIELVLAVWGRSARKRRRCAAGGTPHGILALKQSTFSPDVS